MTRKPRQRPSPPRIPEASLARAVASFLDLALPVDCVFTHIASGGQRNRIVAAKLKAEGVRPGAPDFVVVVPLVGTIWAELKARDGRLSDEQRNWGDALQCTPGVTYGVIYGAEDMERLLRRAGVGLRCSLIGARSA